jgi:hypothetical protein
MLMWAQIRGRHSSFLICGALILLVAFLGLNSGFVGMNVGLHFSPGLIGAQTILIIFWSLYAASVSLTIALWAHPQAVLSESVLRRYPISPTSRFLARHIIGLLNPTWLACILFIIVLLIALVLRRSVAPINALICAPFFISVTYLSAAAALALLRRAASHARNAGLLGMVALVVFTFAGIAIPNLHSPARILSSRALDFLPPAAAARLLLENSPVAFICYGVILAGWCFLLAGLLKRMEVSCPSIAGRCFEKVEAGVARFLARIFGKPRSPLVERCLLYHLRCDRIRANLMVTIPAILLMLHFFDRSQNIAEMLMIRAALLFVSGLFSVSSMMFNAYGYDGGGMARLALYPVPLAATLTSANLASLVLSLAVGSASAILVSATTGFPFDPRTLVVFVSSAWAGSFFLATLGLFSSIFFPKRAHYDRIFGNDSSSGTQGIICAVMFLAFIAAIRLGSKFETSGPVQFWWAFPMLLALCVYLYILSFKWIDRLLARRREDLLQNLCSA